jgi:5'-methylthioadenosine phosphorylase
VTTSEDFVSNDSEEEAVGRPVARVGIISGSGTYEWPGLDDPVQELRRTSHGEVSLTRGRMGTVEIVHLSRHGPEHARLSNHVDHRANIAALLDAEVDCLVSTTVCGAVDPEVPLGSLIVFDDLYFPSNRLPDGSLCTWYSRPGQPGRGHWIFEGPFSAEVRAALTGAALEIGVAASAGCYGYVDGPRFNTRSEIAALAAVGVTAVSQTAGPEVVLAGEAGLPMALVGYATDYANDVSDHSEPVERLFERIRDSTAIFSALVTAVVPRLAEVHPPGVVYRFG